MMESRLTTLTGLLNRMLRGDQQAGNDAMDALYPLVRRLASARLRRERRDHILETQALVNEAMVRLFGGRQVSVQNRQHFLALICLVMKRILIDCGRRHRPEFECFEESMRLLPPPDRERVLMIERILKGLRRLDPPAYRAFELKEGLGFTTDEVAAEMGCSVGSVNRYLKRARTWLHKELRPLSDLRT